MSKKTLGKKLLGQKELGPEKMWSKKNVFQKIKVKKFLDTKRSWYDFLIPSWLPVGSLPVYPIGAKLALHAFMGPEGQ